MKMYKKLKSLIHDLQVMIVYTWIHLPVMFISHYIWIEIKQESKTSLNLITIVHNI